MSKGVAIVTGASRGIGAATAHLLGAKGYRVLVHYHRAEAEAKRVVAAIVERGGEAMAGQADLAVESEMVRLFDAAELSLGPVAALVNNAGVSAKGRVAGLTAEAVSALFAVNVTGVMIGCREALKRMNPGGSIVNVSSEAGRFGGQEMAAYAASKAAVNVFTVACAREAASSGIRVNAVSPGVIDTEANAEIGADKLASLPMGRMGKAEEVAEAIAWLLSDAASYVSGSILSVAGAR